MGQHTARRKELDTMPLSPHPLEGRHVRLEPISTALERKLTRPLNEPSQKPTVSEPLADQVPSPL